MDKYDYVIIGSGIAGLYTALLAKQFGSVLIITKGSIDDCNTRHAQGGIAAPIGENDSAQLHFKDTLRAGAGLSDPEAARIMAEEASDRIYDLVRFGVPFDTVNGAIALTLEAAHSVPRILHAGGDATGALIESTLSRRVLEARIQVLEYCLATDIVTDNGKVKAVKALDLRIGAALEFECRYLILATGGAGNLYKYTTNPGVATGDGVALAYKAGAELTDMEFYQFHPTGLRLPGVAPFLISEAVRGEGGILRNVDGKLFMKEYTPDAELAPRDVVARSIVFEMRKTSSDRVFLDVTHLPAKKIINRFPNIYKYCLDHGLDITRGLIPVAPAAHYMMGGVKTNTWGETNVAGLFAAGETACTGVHGANRLASNSMLEVLIFSKRIIEKSQHAEKNSTDRQIQELVTSLSHRSSLVSVPPVSLNALQNLMWQKVGIIRDKEGLAQAADILAGWFEKLPEPTDRPSYELNNMILTGRLVAEAAGIRMESRGAHFRTDCPHHSPDWEKHLTFVRSL
ncbi:MAG TPA: L-aspartate oxidase [Dehalococcoidales bacterium]|nr:L-aspartate oxidase [Dehalococcoidales bacterium]